MSLAGFQNPVLDQQATFRAVMQALAEPGRIVPAGAMVGEASPLGPVARAIALSLLDFEVKFHLSPSLIGAAGDITFHTGSRLADRADDAEFAFVDCAHDALDLARYAQGTPEYPDRSTTIILKVESLAGGPIYTIAGPGIPGARTLEIPGLPHDFVAQWSANAARSPLGVDLLFVTNEAVLGLPRSTRILPEAR
ncbi:MAG: phosphonate C-P lyase system protein PhnH [Microcystis sp. LE19-4.1E]|jgi:alpha-D-ribose 1-methylphosphonate 5-triphosphate synthase subunit PhnH|nr:phosphonate C-P lyase system protein PhnH [Microcystis sp. LE19-4.1E]